MKIKTSELKGTALDWAVAKIELQAHDDETNLLMVTCGDDNGWIFKPSTNWSQGGLIIEREQITIGYYAKIRGGLGVCATRAKVFDDKGWCLMYGETPLIAAMRCFVASKLGDEVDVPNELLG